MYKKFIQISVVLLILINVIARFSHSFCDWITLYITPISLNTYARLTNWIPFSVGEIFLIIGICYLAVALILLIPCGILIIRKKKDDSLSLQQIRQMKWYQGFYKLFSILLIVVCYIMSLNCFTYYNCTPITFDTETDDTDSIYSSEAITAVRDFIVEQCNTYSTKMTRDEDGYILYDGDIDTVAANALLGLSDEYPKLKGYYPSVKPMLFSDFMSQASITGYYYPFSLEAYYNKNMYIMNLPATYCHELSHLHGYIYEDEANFLSFLACTQIDDDFFNYSGYLSVLNYVDRAFRSSIDNDADVYQNHVAIDSQVYQDNVFLLDSAWDKVESNSILNTQTVNESWNKAMDTSLKLNGVEAGVTSYSLVLKLVLEYYETQGLW